FGDWDAPGDVSPTMVALLAELGRVYLPWVSRACVENRADVVLAPDVRVTVQATDFLRDARATLLARYVTLRSPALDAVLERAGIRGFFADAVSHAGTIPDHRDPPRPAL